MSRSINHGGLVVLLRGRHERLVVEMFSLLMECFPHRQGPPFESAFLTLRVYMTAEQAIGVLNGMMSVLATMKAAGRTPVLNARNKTAGKDEVFILAMLSAAQRAERGRPIEAAIALLDTGYVFGVTVAVRSLAIRLRDAGIHLAPVSEGVFAYLAGYRAITVDKPKQPETDPSAPAPKPALRLLKSA